MWGNKKYEELLTANIILEKYILEGLQAINKNLIAIEKGIKAMTPELKVLADQIALNTKVEESAREAIEGLSDKIEAAKDDPERIVKLAADLKASASALGAAVAANTVADPEAAEKPAAPAEANQALESEVQDGGGQDTSEASMGGGQELGQTPAE